MGCETASIENFYVVRWTMASPAACDRVISELATVKGPIAYLGIMPADMARIDEGGRKGLMKLTKALGSHPELTAAIAMEGRGFAGSATRSMLSGIMLVQGLGSRIKFVDSVDAAMKHLGALPRANPDVLRTAIEKVGGAWPKAKP